MLAAGEGELLAGRAAGSEELDLANGKRPLFEQLTFSSAAVADIFSDRATCRPCSISRRRWRRAEAAGRGDPGDARSLRSDRLRRGVVRSRRARRGRPCRQPGDPAGQGADRQGATRRRARYVHWGATSQDVIDTGHRAARCARASTHIAPELVARSDGAARSRCARGTGMPGRTLMQQALPITFGLKAAGWLSALTARGGAAAPRAQARRWRCSSAAPPGTLAALGADGAEGCRRARQELELNAAADAPGTPSATASPTSPRRSRALPAAAARSPATCCS